MINVPIATLIPCSRRKCPTWDVTVTDAFTKSHLPATSLAAGAAAEKAVSLKTNKHEDLGYMQTTHSPSNPLPRLITPSPTLKSWTGLVRYLTETWSELTLNCTCPIERGIPTGGLSRGDYIGGGIVRLPQKTYLFVHITIETSGYFNHPVHSLFLSIR